MPLKIKGSVLVDAPRDKVWTLLFDPQLLMKMANKVPGVQVERLVQIAPDRYEGAATLGVANIRGRYEGAIIVVDRREPEFVKFRGDGKGSGNWANGEMSLMLNAQADKTLLEYDGTGNVGGALASVGQRLIDTVGKQFIQQGTRALAEEIAAQSRAPSA